MGTKKLLIAQLYDLRPSEVIDPFYECNLLVRDEIDLLYKTTHEKRIISILKGELTITGEKPIPRDPYPRPQHCDSSIFQKGSRFLKKMAHEAGW
jgi:hypothetical protein